MVYKHKSRLIGISKDRFRGFTHFKGKACCQNKGTSDSKSDCILYSVVLKVILLLNKRALYEIMLSDLIIFNIKHCRPYYA